jgi:hypothetical protein
MSASTEKPNPFKKILGQQPELEELFSWTLNQFVAQKIGGKSQSDKERRESIKKKILQSLNSPTSPR